MITEDLTLTATDADLDELVETRFRRAAGFPSVLAVLLNNLAQVGRQLRALTDAQRQAILIRSVQMEIMGGTRDEPPSFVVSSALGGGTGRPSWEASAGGRKCKLIMPSESSYLRVLDAAFHSRTGMAPPSPSWRHEGIPLVVFRNVDSQVRLLGTLTGTTVSVKVSYHFPLVDRWHKLSPVIRGLCEGTGRDFGMSPVHILEAEVNELMRRAGGRFEEDVRARLGESEEERRTHGLPPLPSTPMPARVTPGDYTTPIAGVDRVVRRLNEDASWL